MMHYSDSEREEPCGYQAAQDRELARADRRVEWVAMAYTAAVADTALAGIHIDWPQHSERSRKASRAVARAFLCNPDSYSAADAQRDWAAAMLEWCLDRGEVQPDDASLTYAEMPLLSQLAEMNGLRAMRAVFH
jgi:hypothetical protein